MTTKKTAAELAAKNAKDYFALVKKKDHAKVAELIGGDPKVIEEAFKRTKVDLVSVDPAENPEEDYAVAVWVSQDGPTGVRVRHTARIRYNAGEKRLYFKPEDAQFAKSEPVEEPKPPEAGK